MAYDEMPGIAEVVWVQRIDDENHIRHAKFDGQQWQQTSASLYSSNAPLTGPTINTKSNGDRLLIWVEKIKNRTVLKQMTGHHLRAISHPVPAKRIGEHYWSKASVLSKFRLENFAPSIVVDARQRFWVVWSSSSATQSDIFMIRELGSHWSSPAKVNPDNQTPDMRPIVNTDITGNIYIVWTGYDRVIDGFTQNSAFYSMNGDKLDDNSLDYADSLQAHKTKEHGITSITDPGFLPAQSRILIHFPQNKLVQSVSR